MYVYIYVQDRTEHSLYFTPLEFLESESESNSKLEIEAEAHSSIFFCSSIYGHIVVVFSNAVHLTFPSTNGGRTVEIVS